jgi:glycosyltransferase involved in cell wall biosynthesis
MRFSVLLPSHNGLQFLRYAVQSVLRQDHTDWELVISDNHSTDDIGGYVATLADDRIRYVCTEDFISVTDNWNNALRHSTGDYVVMLGNDDALLPGYFSALSETIELLGELDAIYTAALLYAYPGVLPNVPEGYLEIQHYAPFFAGADEPFLLAPDAARQLARDAMAMRARYAFNMQFIALKRETIDGLAGDGEFFRSPFPDFYAMNLVFAMAPRIAVDPQPRVIIGITPASHGYLYFNHRESDALALLNTANVDADIRHDLEPVLRPGTNMNTSWLLAMEALSRRLGSPPDMQPDYHRYQRLQALFCLQAYYLHQTITRDELRASTAVLTVVERMGAAVLGPVCGALLRHSPASLRRALGGIYDRIVRQFPGGGERPDREVGRYRDALEVFDSVSAQPLAAKP